MTDREIFQTNLIKLMKTTKTRQSDLAEYAEVSYKTVSAWVCGRGYPRVDAMEKLCKFFGIKQSVLTESQEETDEDKLLFAFHSMSDIGKGLLLDRASELLLLHPKKGKKNG